MMDAVLDRIVFEAKPEKLAPIPWPAGLEPTLHGGHAPPEIPEADVLVVTYTAAEGQALADVLTPGHPSSSWAKYVEGWASYEPELTDRSPARDSKCLGIWAVTTIDGKSVVLFKSDLHLSTDAVSLPVKRLLAQLVATVKPKLVITTGTAGGIGVGTQLGDVAVTNGAKFNCQQAFKSAPFAQETYQGPAWAPGPQLTIKAPRLMRANAAHLKPVASRAPRITCITDGPGVETVDYFAFADATDSYGVVANDPHALTEEMDDAVLPLALSPHFGEGGSEPDTPGVHIPWLSIRNASDPQVPHMQDLEAEKKWAEGIYARYGYWTTVCSAIACWGVIADL